MKYSADDFCAYYHSILAAAVTDATTEGTTVDCKGFDEALVVFDATLAAANAEGNLKVQESSDDSTWADVAGAAFTEITPSNDADSFEGRIDLSKRSRYLRLHLTTDGSNAFTGSGGFVLIHPKYGPASHNNTVVFDV